MRQLFADRRTARPLGLALVAGVVGQVCTVVFLLAIASIVDGVFVDGRGPAELTTPAAVALVALAVRAVAIVGAEIGAAHASARVRGSTRDQLVRRLFVLGPGGLVRHRSGEVAQVVGSGVEALDAYVTRFVPAMVLAVTGPLVVFVAVAVLDPWTTLILLFTGPMLVLLLAVIGGRTRTMTQRRHAELGWLSGFYLDMIRGLPTLRAFGRAGDGGDRIEEVSRRFGETTMEVLRTAFQSSLMMEWAATAATALVAVEVSFRMIESDLSFAVGLGVLVIVPEFFLPFRRLALEYHAGQEGRAALERIADLTAIEDPAAPHAAPPPTDTPDLPLSPAPSIEFVGVSYTYPGSSSPALDGLDLRIEGGTSLALVGPTGAGKSTAIRLLMRFVEPADGHVSIDGTPIDRFDAETWRRQVAWVSQDPAILAGTIADNIRLGRPDATLAEVRAAAESARAVGFVDQLPDGFDTVLGEHGLRLSGGQRQRLAIARAILRDAPVVVLDEFTAHLDDDTEADVVAATTALLAGRTALIVAHRPRTIAIADRVVALDAGRAAAPASPPAPDAPALPDAPDAPAMTVRS